jgi:hypothetical protein
VTALALISCVSRKRTSLCAARDLYTSDWFKKARAYVEARQYPWQILSARHCLLDPDKVIGPYEQTLNTMGIAARRAWAERVLAALVPRLANVDRIVILAGDRYRAFLVPRIQEMGIEVEIPLLGLGIGQQLKWFKDREANP